MARKHAEPDGDECMAEGGQVALKRGGIGMGKQTMDMPRPEHAMGGGVRRPRRAAGGVHKYNAVGSPTMESAESESEDGFGRGGRKKRAAGGTAEGMFAGGRADRAPRGRNAGGRSPYAKGGKVFSEAAELKPYENGDKASRGHEGQEVGSQPGPG